MHRHAAPGTARRSDGTGCRTGASHRGGKRARAIRASNTSKKPAKTLISLSGCAADRRRRAARRSGGADAGAAGFPRRRDPHDGGSRGRGRADGERSAHARPLHRAGAGEAVVAGAQSLVELGPGHGQLIPQSGSGALAAAQSESDRAACRRCRWRRSRSAPRNSCCTAGSTTRIAACRSICEPTGPGARSMRPCCGPRPVAYFSAEFGIHESLPIYSGGLGVLAGDHIKSASDLDIPLIAVGLFYGQGYFRQRLDRNGWQQEEYLPTDVNRYRWNRRSGPMVSRSRCRSKRAAGRSARRCGGSKWAGSICCCSIPTSTATLPKIANLRRGCTAAMAGSASARNCCWEWAVSAR